MIGNSQVSITMPYSEYENMKEEIKQLKKERLSNYVDYDWSHVVKGKEKPSDVVIIFDQEKAIKDIAAANPEIKTVNVKYEGGLTFHTFKVNGGEDNATNN